jgi:hypothetical protein
MIGDVCKGVCEQLHVCGRVSMDKWVTVCVVRLQISSGTDLGTDPPKPEWP